MPALTALPPAYPLDSGLDDDGRFQIGGCDAIALAAEPGTPAYVVAEEDLRTRARAYVDALAAQHAGPGLILYALKAFPATAVVRTIAREGCGTLVSSGGELAVALRAGVPVERIAMHGNAKSLREIEEAVAAGIGYLILDSVHDLDKLEVVLRGRGRAAAPVPVLLRITPGVETDTHAAIATGQDESKFGVALHEAPALIERLENHPEIDLKGLHAHIGSQLLDLRAYHATVTALDPLGRFGTYDFGGGLGAPYLDSDRPPAIEDHVATVARAVRELLGADVALLLEPGRALVANATVTLYRVESVKRNVHNWVCVDGGMSDNLRPMLYGARYEAEIADRFTSIDAPGVSCRVAGKHCESGDVIINAAYLRDPTPGDVVVVPATGAYGHALANTYNSQPRPPVVFCAGGRSRVVVRRETYADLAARDVQEDQA